MAELIRYLWADRPKGNIRTIPWGYEDKAGTLVPIPDMLDHMELAKRMLATGQPSRSVVSWLVESTGVSISHAGLIKRWKTDNKRFLNFDPEEAHRVYWEGDVKPSEYASPTARKIIKTDQKLIKGQENPEAKQFMREKIKLRNAKKQMTRSLNRMKSLADSSGEEVKELLTEGVAEELANTSEKIEVIFKPNSKPQEDFLSASEDEVFYGGAKGGGKTYSLVADPLAHIHNPEFRGILFRRTTIELREVIRTSKKLYGNDLIKGKWSESGKFWTFPSGAILELGYGETEDDVERYRGNQYSWLGFDELPQWPDSSVFEAMKSCVRTTKSSGLKTYVRASGNPGNVGSAWVKKYFIDPAPANTTFYNSHHFKHPITKERITVRTSIRYIPATLFDNPDIDQEQYLSKLASLPEKKRKQMLEGNWDVVEGSAFEEFDRDVHVCKPFRIPSNWIRFRAADWGYSSPFCCLWFAIDWDDNVYVYREYYGQGVYDEDWGHEIANKEKEKIDYGVIDGSSDSNRGSNVDSPFKKINRVLKQRRRVMFRKADRSPDSRAAGKQAVHNFLALRDTGQLDDMGNPVKRPRLVIFDTCTNLIRTLPVLVADKNDPEKVAKNQEDHAYDALQYGLRTRPKSPRVEFETNIRPEKKWVAADKTFGY